MKKSYHFLLVALFFSSFTLSGIAQTTKNLTVDDAISYINEKIAGIAKIKNVRGEMYIDFYEKGKVIRNDRVPFEDLNGDNVDYAPDEKAILLKCAAKDCIERVIFVPKTRGQFSRISIPIDCDKKTQMGLIHAFEHLLLSFKDPKYKSNKPFER